MLSPGRLTRSIHCHGAFPPTLVWGCDPRRPAGLPFQLTHNRSVRGSSKPTGKRSRLNGACVECGVSPGCDKEAWVGPIVGSSHGERLPLSSNPSIYPSLGSPDVVNEHKNKSRWVQGSGGETSELAKEPGRKSSHVLSSATTPPINTALIAVT